MIIGILYISLIFLIAFTIAYILPIFITGKIFNLELSKKRFFRLLLIMLFFPISLFFTKATYLDFKNNNKIEGILGFMKIISVIILFMILTSVFINNMVIKKYIASFFQMSGQSMYSTIYDREILLTNKLSFNYDRGDIIIMKDKNRFYIKRIIGLSNEKLKISNGKVFISNNDKYIELDEKYLDENNKNLTFVSGKKEDVIYDIPNNTYFVMGDNRNASTDSRTCFSSCFIEGESEFLIEDNIVGKVYFDLGYFNLKTFTFNHKLLGISTFPKFFNIK